MSTKYNCAMKLSKIGPYGHSFGAMWEMIPESAKSRLPASALAEMVDAMWAVSQRSKRIAEEEAIENGSVWDHRNDRAVDLVA